MKTYEELRELFRLAAAAFCAVVLISGCGPEAFPDPGAEPARPEKEPALGQRQDEVVYGTDDRRDVYDHSDALLRARAHQSTVAVMQSAMLNTANPNNITLNALPLGIAKNLCLTERFLTDPVAASCSGTLIDDDLVLTAGHCIDGTVSVTCANARFVFNYYRPELNLLQPITLADVFSCQSVVVYKLEMVGGKRLDYAIVQLDRKATPRYTPAPVRTETSALALQQGVAVIGSSSGIPYKLDSGGKVRDPRAGVMDYFVATTDTFKGNSGSGVYETATYSLVGHNISGDTDYVPNGICNIVNTCAENACKGEFVSYLTPALQAYCAVASNPRLCGGGSTENTMVYQASNTNDGTVFTVNRSISLAAGQTVVLGTCGLSGAFARGDTFLRLFGPANNEVASNDDGCTGNASMIKYTVPAGQGGLYQIRAGCFSNWGCGGTVTWSLGALSYSATNTNSATINTANRKFTLAEGQQINLGTCGLSGASANGDTYLRLYGPDGIQAAFNDDACGGHASNLTFKVPVGKGGIYELRAGCYQGGSCDGTVAWSISGGPSSIVYYGSNTNNATSNTENRDLVLSAGHVLKVGTCGTPNAYTNSDTYLRLRDPNGVEVELNDDACGHGSQLTHTALMSGIYQLRAGCYSNQSCSGTVAWSTQ